jgi:hypothetical protein
LPALTLWKDFLAMSAPQNGLFRAAVAMAPATVLRCMADVARSGESPEVTVWLAGGQVLGGVPVRVDVDLRSEVVVLADAGTGRLRYVLLSSVVAVEVHHPERVQDILTKGRLPQPGAGQPASKLALRREFAPSPGFPVDVDWAALPDSDAALVNLERLLHGLREIVGEVRADELGREALARIGTVTVAHHPDAPPSVQPVPDGLSVRADLVAALPRELTGQLRGQLNALL